MLLPSSKVRTLSEGVIVSDHSVRGRQKLGITLLDPTSGDTELGSRYQSP